MKKLIFALIAAATAMGSAQAQQGSPYVGVGVSSVDHSVSLPGTTNGNSDGYKASGKIFGGYDFDKTWGVEAGYVDYRKSDYSYNLGTQTIHGQSEGHSTYIAGKATAPINDQFSVFGKLGVAENKVKLNDPIFKGDTKTEVYAGVGGQYNLNQKVALTLEYERFGKSKDIGQKADVITVGAKYAF
jgi:opacity protein-like surface antigen